jgi:hypothetical protein
VLNVSAAVSSDIDEPFFDSLVRGYVEKNRRFVRRDWLAKELDAKLTEPSKCFVLLPAAPGAGKSAFLAQLAHDHPDWLRYFMRLDQRLVLADVMRSATTPPPRTSLPGSPTARSCLRTSGSS